MEILSPASNMEHIEVAIDEKANAVYGGLKKWNARNKAINFSTEEYNELIEQLHVHNIKFYLTLNILMLDEEIEEVIQFLKHNKLPDAFIVADIGLIQRLKKEFPTVPLHFSTQFGAHNSDDVKYIQSLNGTRAILARELTFKEIKRIEENAQIELECFVWGSQCLSFSGLCFFGTLINGGGGNRGKCLITCRDIYSINDDYGHYLYVPDMDAIKLVSKLDKIDCLKIEGRRRNPEEIRKIIKQIKTTTSTAEKGYLYGTNIKENHLYEHLNKREKPFLKASLLKDINENDICMRFENNSPIEFSKDYKNDNVYYMYTEYKKPYDINKKNIFIELKLSIQNEIKEVLIVNHNGDGKTFIEETQDYITFQAKEMVDCLEKEGINLYKIKYKRNISNELMISKKMYDAIIAFIIQHAKGKEYSLSHYNLSFQEIYLETSNLQIIEKYKNNSFIKIIYNIESLQKLKEIDSVIQKYQDLIIYKLPLFNWQGEEVLQYYKKLENKEVMFTRLTQLYICKDIKFKAKYTDYTIYIWNHSALEYLKDYGIDMFTASFELSYFRNKEIFTDNPYQLILGGKLPLVYTRGCFSHLFKCQNCISNQKKSKEIKNVDKDLDFEIYCNDDYRTILNKNPILNDYSKFKNAQNISYRYVVSNESLEELDRIIATLKENDYYESLKKNDYFKDSYECNLLEGKE